MGLKHQGNSNLVKNSHKMLNVVRFKQVQTHTQMWWYTQCATVSDSFLWFWSKIKGRKRSVLLTWVKISGILVVMFTMQKCSWIIWTLHGLLLFGRLPLINPLAATKYTLLSLTIIVAMLHKVSTNSELEATGLLQEKNAGLGSFNIPFLFIYKPNFHSHFILFSTLLSLMFLFMDFCHIKFFPSITLTWFFLSASCFISYIPSLYTLSSSLIQILVSFTMNFVRWRGWDWWACGLHSVLIFWYTFNNLGFLSCIQNSRSL